MSNYSHSRVFKSTEKHSTKNKINKFNIKYKLAECACRWYWSVTALNPSHYKNLYHHDFINYSNNNNYFYSFGSYREDILKWSLTSSKIAAMNSF